MSSTSASERRDGHDLRWFLDGLPIRPGNRVHLLVDGAEYFAQWFSGVDALAMSDLTDNARIWHIAWRLSDVGRDGRLSRNERVLDRLRAAARRGVEVCVIVSAHGWGVAAWALVGKLLRHVRSGLAVVLDATPASPVSANHQKLSIFSVGAKRWALLGSVDLAPSRFEQSHLRIDESRYATPRGPSHDIGLRLDGPIVTDLQHHFIARWNPMIADPGRRRVVVIGRPNAQPEPDEVDDADTGCGGATAQLVTTVPNKSDVALAPCRDLLDLFIRTLANARDYIYIEDQYFNPLLRDTAAGCDSFDEDHDLLPAMEAALERGVHLVVLLPTLRDGVVSPTDRIIRRRRHLALSRLASVDQKVAHEGTSLLHVFCYQLPTHPVYVHSKLLLADDEFAIIGSANVNRRGMSSDFEFAVGICDKNFVAATRRRLWHEHFGLNPASTLDAVDALATMRLEPTQAAQKYPRFRTPGPIRPASRWLLDHLVDPP